MSTNFGGLPSGAPAAAPPPGVVPNLDHPESNDSQFVVLGIFVSLSLFAVSIRIFVRFRLTKSWGWDDYTCILAAIASLSYTIIYGQVIATYPVKHKWDIALSAYPNEIEAQSISLNGVSYQVTIFLTKLSILLLYLRLFNVNRRFALVVTISIFVISLFYIPMLGVGIGFFATCDKLMQFAKLHFCRDYTGPVLLLNASFNVITGFWLLLLPFPVVAKLQLPLRKKLGLTAVFAAGAGACATSLARLIKIAVDYGSPDYVWNAGITAQFSIVEINVGIIVACVSTFPVFFDQVRSWLGRTTGSLKPTQAQDPEPDVGPAV
ncbi:hypothetical protein GGR58DRAFT_490286 [Xylaria digitata]|nr:hypothetical protein GGR58DRAFT_490286 [Xylaria digitata]